MAILGYLIVAVGVIVAIGSGIGILIAAFNESVIWGIGCLVVPVVSLIFVITHWAETKKLFSYNLAGSAAIFLGMMLVHSGGA